VRRVTGTNKTTAEDRSEMRSASQTRQINRAGSGKPSYQFPSGQLFRNGF